MVQQYTIAGRQVGSHYLAIATLTALFGGIYASTGGAKKTTATPPINASSSDEADFITKFLAEADAEEKKTKESH
ncbi:hypothetical protein SEUCBS139899_002368 [Sporothrix eucalyptigena]|uniref:ATP synthase subunit K n=1 Tax=Sporothrix eucalyptigena TaxID=1812306 RepID=A0ABP0B2L0_9PEZI